MPPHARLLLVDFWTDLTHTQPPSAALEAAEFLALVGGDVYSDAEARKWLAEIGWLTVDHVPLTGGASLIVAEPAA